MLPAPSHQRYADRFQFPIGAPGTCRFCRGCFSSSAYRNFCGHDCLKLFRMYCTGSGLREAVFDRDKGVCAVCGLDCTALTRRLAKMTPAGRASLSRRLRIAARSKSYWQADHRVPVREGGGTCGLNNLQTLCVWCHRVKSEADKRHRAGLGPVPGKPNGLTQVLAAERAELATRHTFLDTGEI